MALNNQFVFEILAQTKGLTDAQKQLSAINAEIAKTYGKDFELSGIKKIQADSQGATTAVLQLNNALTKTNVTAKLTTAGNLSGYNVTNPAGLSWSQNARGGQGAWRNEQGQFASTPIGWEKGPKSEPVKEYNATLETTSAAADKAAKAHENLIASQLKLAARAIAVIPVWMALRAVYATILGTIGDVIKEYQALDVGMRKVMAVTQTTATTQKAVYAGMETAARRYFATSSVGFKEITEAMYQLGNAGRSNEEIMKGFTHILDLAKGTFGDTTTVARAVSGILNVFGDELERVGDQEQKIAYITDTMALAWQKHNIEINEMAQAMTYLASAGNLTGVSFETLIAASSVMSDAMLKGGRGGRNLAMGLSQAATNMDKLKDLGFVFDPDKPLEFVKLMEFLVNKYKDQAKNLHNLKEVTGVFGQEGTRAIGNLILNWDLFNKALNETGNRIDGLDKKLRENAEKDWGSIIKRLINEATVGIEVSKEGGGLKEILLGRLKDTDIMRELVTDIELLGSKLSLTKKQAKELADELQRYNAPDTSKKIQEMFGVKTNALRSFGAGKIQDSSRSAIASVMRQILDLKQEEQNQRNKQNKLLEEEISKNKALKQLEEDKLQALPEVEKWYKSLTEAQQKNYDIEVQLGVAKAANVYTTKELLQLEYNLTREKAAQFPQETEKLKLLSLQRQILEEQTKEVVKYSDQLKSGVASSFKDLLLRKTDLAGAGKALADSFNDILATNISDSLTTNLFQNTGIGNLFGNQMVGIENLLKGKSNPAADYHARVVNSAIKSGADYHATLLGLKTGGSVSSFMTGGLSTGSAGGWTLPGFGTGGFFNTQIGNSKAIGTDAKTGLPMLANGQLLKTPTYGQALGVAGGTALAGYSAYQNAGGSNGSLGVASGMLGGLGSLGMGMASMGFMGAGTAAAYGMGAFLGPVGLALSVGAMLLSAFSKTKQSSTEIKDTTTTVASKIDISNTRLDLINRNLVALRNTMEVYMLPSSAFFSTKSGATLEDQFSLSMRR